MIIYVFSVLKDRRKDKHKDLILWDVERIFGISHKDRQTKDWQAKVDIFVRCRRTYILNRKKGDGVHLGGATPDPSPNHPFERKKIMGGGVGSPTTYPQPSIKKKKNGTTPLPPYQNPSKTLTKQKTKNGGYIREGHPPPPNLSILEKNGSGL